MPDPASSRSRTPLPRNRHNSRHRRPHHTADAFDAGADAGRHARAEAKEITEMKLMRTTELPINWDKRIDFITWHKKDADHAVKCVEPLIGHKVLLYGGGSVSDSNICTLKSVSLVLCSLKNEFFVDIELIDVQPAIFGEHKFSPHLGSWRIAKIVINEDG